MQRLEGLFVRELQQEIEVETASTGVAQRPVETGRRWMEEQWYVESHERVVQRVESRVIEVDAEIGPDRHAQQAEFAHAAARLEDRRVDVLHRQRGQATQPRRVASDEGRQVVVMAGAERDRGRGVDVMEVCEWVRREHLEIDACLIHRRQPHLDVHEGAAFVPDAAEGVVADAEDGGAFRVRAEFGTMLARCAHRAPEHHVRVDVDARSLSIFVQSFGPWV